MEMRTIQQARNPVQNLVVSYETRVDELRGIIDNTYQALDNSNVKNTELNVELKESLANKIISEIFLNQEKKEKEVKQNLKKFIEKQKKETNELKDALTKGEIERIRKAQIGIENGIAEIKGLLKGFYGQQRKLSGELRELWTRGKNLVDFRDTEQSLQNLTK